MSADKDPSLQFVDTNVLVYAHDTSAGKKRHIAVGLLENLWQTRQGCISIQVLQEFLVVTTSKAASPLTMHTARLILAKYKSWPVHSPTVDDVDRAADIRERYGISFWDAMIVQSANRLGCSTLWSEDLNHGQVYDGVTVRNPFTAQLG